MTTQELSLESIQHKLASSAKSAAFRTAFSFHKTGVQLRELQASIDRLAVRWGIDINDRTVDDSVADVLDAVRQVRTAFTS
jgi:hypothetical protein